MWLSCFTCSRACRASDNTAVGYLSGWRINVASDGTAGKIHYWVANQEQLLLPVIQIFVLGIWQP